MEDLKSPEQLEDLHDTKNMSDIFKYSAGVITEDKFIDVSHSYLAGVRKDGSSLSQEIIDHPVVAGRHGFGLLQFIISMADHIEKKHNLDLADHSAEASAIVQPHIHYEVSNIKFDDFTGTHTPIILDDQFKQYLESSPLKKPINLPETEFQLFRVDANTFAISSMPGAPGIQIQKRGDKYIACNNQRADLQDDRYQFFIQTLTSIQNIDLSPPQARHTASP